jgi:hypothetical protein
MSPMRPRTPWLGLVTDRTDRSDVVAGRVGEAVEGVVEQSLDPPATVGASHPSDVSAPPRDDGRRYDRPPTRAGDRRPGAHRVRCRAELPPPPLRAQPPRQRRTVVPDRGRPPRRWSRGDAPRACPGLGVGSVRLSRARTIAGVSPRGRASSVRRGPARTGGMVLHRRRSRSGEEHPAARCRPRPAAPDRRHHRSSWR